MLPGAADNHQCLTSRIQPVTVDVLSLDACSASSSICIVNISDNRFTIIHLPGLDE